MRLRNGKGQSILEYTLILAAIIGVLVWIILKQGGIKDTVSGAYDRSNTAVNKTTEELDFGIYSGSSTPGGGGGGGGTNVTNNVTNPTG